MTEYKEVKLLNIAAALVRGDYCMPSHQEDYNMHVPKWMLRKLEKQRDSHRCLGMKIHSVYDDIKKTREES